MKKFLLPLLFLPLSSLALDTSIDTSSELNDLMYLPKAGTIFTKLQYTRANLDTDIMFNNRNVANAETTKDVATLTVGSSIRDNLSWELKVPYTFKSENETTYGVASTLNGTTAKSESKGLNDVALSAKYRVLNQTDSVTLLDLKLGVSPKTGDAETASTTKDGNEFRGGTDVNVAAEIGKKFKQLSLSFETTLDFVGKATGKDLSDNTETKNDSHLDFSVAWNVMIEPTESFSIVGAIGMDLIGGYNSTNDGTTSEFDYDPAFLIGLETTYLMTPNCSLSLNFTYLKGDYEVTQGTTNLEYERKNSSFGAALEFQF